MDRERRRRLAEAALAGYHHGPHAPIEATRAALERAQTARAVVLVEGVSDQIALETLASRYQRDLEAERIVIIPVGGAHAFARFIEQFGPHGANLALVGMCDSGEAEQVADGLESGGLSRPGSSEELSELGFAVCVEDLEDELIRAAGRAALEALLDSQGDLSSFRTLQSQPAWRNEPFEAQLRRWFGSGARRKLRYAKLTVESLPLERIPEPLAATLERVGGSWDNSITS